MQIVRMSKGKMSSGELKGYECLAQ